MFTSRGYRRASKENKKYSRTGQIIQKKPVFQIDNNPVVLDAYKKFILDTMPKPLLKGYIKKDTITVPLSDYSLSWNQNTSYSDIYSILIAFANEIFNSYRSSGKYPVSLVLYSPNDDTKGWAVMNNYLSSIYVPVYELVKEIIIDNTGNLSYTQYGNNYYAIAQLQGSLGPSTTTLGYATLASGGDLTFGNPISMKMDVNYYNIYKGN